MVARSKQIFQSGGGTIMLVPVAVTDKRYESQKFAQVLENAAS
ncbi:hypothetical protein [Iodidimonas gelatinilytica]|nr:hypothetical protein [Iodidimonas gelatinilytica]